MYLYVCVCVYLFMEQVLVLIHGPEAMVVCTKKAVYFVVRFVWTCVYVCIFVCMEQVHVLIHGPEAMVALRAWKRRCILW
jgi:hypothetical protein